MTSNERVALFKELYRFHVAAATGKNEEERRSAIRKVYDLVTTTTIGMPPAIMGSFAIELIESWPDPEAAYQLLDDCADLIAHFGCSLGAGVLRYMSAEDNVLVMYGVPHNWPFVTKAGSPYRIELYLEHNTILARDMVSGKQKIINRPE